MSMAPLWGGLQSARSVQVDPTNLQEEREIMLPAVHPKVGRPRAVALHFVRRDQFTPGLAPSGVRPCPLTQRALIDMHALNHIQRSPNSLCQRYLRGVAVNEQDCTTQ